MTTAPQLPRAFDVTLLCVPREVRLENDSLIWRWLEVRQQPVKRVQATDALERFLKIQDSKGVLRFARRFGPLGLCQHGELLGKAAAVSRPGHFYCRPAEHEGWSGERVKWWLTLARAMRAIENTAARLKRAQRPLREDLFTLNQTFTWGIEPTALDRELNAKDKLASDAEKWSADGDILPRIEDTPADGARSQAWMLVLVLLNEFLKACSVRLDFTNAQPVALAMMSFAPRRPVDFTMSFVAGDNRGCFPALVFELIGRIRGEPGKFMVRCAHCKDPIAPRHEPRGSERIFCAACRAQGWPVRYANRDYYERSRNKILAGRKKKRQQREQ